MHRCWSGEALRTLLGRCCGQGYVVAKASHHQNKGEQWQGEESLTRKSERGINQVELSV